MVLLTGCSTEQEIVDSDNGGTTKGKITFSFPISKGASTYSTVTAVGNESLFSAADMTIYMVNALDKVEYIFSGASITGSGSGTTQMATIILPADATTDKRFYFVANTSSVSTALSSITVDSSLSDLLTVVTNVQSAHLSSASGLLLTGSVTVPVADLTPATPTPISVTLKRRVARFDISNDASTAKVTIKKVLISDAKTTALAFADKDSLPLTKSNLPEIVFAADSKVNKGDTASVFYLYPSDSVSIQLLAESEGVEKLYKLPLPTGGIKANKCYTIKAKYNTTKPSFDLVTEEWTQGEEIEAYVNSSVDIVSSNITGYSAGWDAEASQYDVNAISGSTPTTIELTVSTSSSMGAAISLEGTIPTGYTITATPGTPTLTYAAGYRQTVTITVPQYTLGAPLDAKVIIKDMSNPAQSKTISITHKDYYPTAHKGWAGCNIYYDEVNKHLTFDDIGVTEHEQYQGVYFKWGSLWGISPKGAWSGTTRLYPPTGDTISAKDRNPSFDWETIPFVDTLLQLNPAIETQRRDWAYLYQITNGETGKGDICKWLTQKGWAPEGKKWRMPTSSEFETKANYVKNTGGFTSQTSTLEDGKHIMNSGYRKGTGSAPFFPASGRRDSTGMLGRVGTNGGYYSSSPNNIQGYYLDFSGGTMTLAGLNSRSTSRTVRCVVE